MFYLFVKFWQRNYNLYPEKVEYSAFKYWPGFTCVDSQTCSPCLREPTYVSLVEYKSLLFCA